MTATHEQIIERLERGDARFDELEGTLAGMRSDVAATREVVEAMAAVKTMAKFIKWLASVLAAGAILWAMMKGWVFK